MKKKCCFAGHSEIAGKEELYERLISAIEELILTDGICEFWTGNYGEFDKLAARAVRELKGKHPEIQLILVIPYLTSEINEYREQYYRDYDDILVAELPENTPGRLKIIKANQYMVQSCDAIVAFVEHPLATLWPKT